MHHLIVTEVAELSALVATIYYEEQRAGLGDVFLIELENTYRKIIEHPQYYSYISSNDEFRSLKMYKFPYVIIYIIRNNDVVVLDVFNTYREPIQ